MDLPEIGDYLELFTKVRATEIAAELSAGEDNGWAYEVVPDPNDPVHFGSVAIFDENKQFVSYWRGR